MVKYRVEDMECDQRSKSGKINVSRNNKTVAQDQPFEFESKTIKTTDFQSRGKKIY